MKRIMILGAGNAQLDAIEYCKKAGYEVSGCSYTTLEKGIRYLDFYDNVDIKDLDGVREAAVRRNVDIIYSVGSDIAMPTAMKASEEIGLPHFISSECSEICLNKDRMRECLGQDFSGNISYKIYTSLEEALSHDRFPSMMKPTDSQGQRGCVKVESKDDIAYNYKNTVAHSTSGKVIIEDYIEGPEVSVNAYMSNGNIQAAYISDRYSIADYPGGIVKKHVIPSSVGTDVASRIRLLSEKAIRRLGIENGPCYIQMKVCQNGEPKIIEISPRLDGCHMWKLIKYCYGVDLIDITFRDLIGKEEKGYIWNEKPSGVYRLEYFLQEPRSVFFKSKHEVESGIETCYYYEDEDIIRPINGYFEKCGYTIYKAE